MLDVGLVGVEYTKFCRLLAHLTQELFMKKIIFDRTLLVCGL